MKDMIMQFISITMILICVGMMIGVPCYHEYKIAKRAGKLDPKRNFLLNFFFPPVC